MTSPVHFGADLLARDPSALTGIRRVGLLTNDAARTADDPGTPTRVALLKAGVPLVRLFGPEHGLAARAADGSAVADGRDEATGLPVVSLYGERLRPEPSQLADLDAVLVDLPDVGARFYTYPWTITHMVDACAGPKVPVIVLDRPNPLGGLLADCEGPMLDEATCASFVGRFAIPVRHSLTLGELALLWARERAPRADVRVIAAAGWRREMSWEETGCAWIPPSPAMTALEGARLYPGTCLFEGTNVSVGRGTERPFRWLGAPWLDAAWIAERLAQQHAAGVEAEPFTLTPAAGPHAGHACAGLRLRVTDARALRPVALGLRLLALVVERHRREFDWGGYVTVANPTGASHFERLAGRQGIRERISEGAGAITDREIAAWTAVTDWPARVRPVLQYVSMDHDGGRSTQRMTTA